MRSGEGLADELRLAGAYPDLLARARHKRSLLERQGQPNPALSALAVSADEVLRWYFCERLGLGAVPDTAAWSQAQGFADDEAFRRALAREYCFAMATATARPDHGRGPGAGRWRSLSCSAGRRKTPTPTTADCGPRGRSTGTRAWRRGCSPTM